MNPLRILAGKKARAHLAQHGLQASDVRAMPAAAGGPKGLLLNALDQYLFGDWFTHTENPVHLVGASIGAWRMACAASQRPAQALQTLARLYMEEQRYERKATRADIDAVCERILGQLLAQFDGGIFTQNRYALHLLTVRGVGALAHPQRGHALGFAKAVAANALARRHLGRSMERVVFQHGPPLHFLPASESVYTSFDRLPTRTVPLTAANLQPVLAASGAIPLLISPQLTIPGAPNGPYWDGGMSDYHIHWPWPCLGGLTLYPHFAPYIVPGWLDKFLTYRRAGGDWLDNTVLLCPSDAFIRSLPHGKIPDRKDFAHYGLDWRKREAAWNAAIGQGALLADAFARFVAKPDLAMVEAI